MRQSICSLTISVSLLIAACSTPHVQEFHGEVRNIRRDGQSEKVDSPITHTCGGHLKNGGFYRGLGVMDPEFSFVLFNPKLASGKTLTLNSESKEVAAWLFRGLDACDLLWSGKPELIRQYGGEPLEGQITVRWKSNVDYTIGVDLRSTGSGAASLKGEFVGYTGLEFAPNDVGLGVSMVGMMAAGALRGPFPEAYEPYPRSQETSKTARYLLKISGDQAVLTAFNREEDPIFERSYLVTKDGRCLPHGEWKRYSQRGYLIEKTQYRNGKFSGEHWMKFDLLEYGGEDFESHWNGRTPVGTWKITVNDGVHVLIHFKDGKEVLKESFGMTRGKKVLLRRWKHGKETFKAEWVKVPAPKLADRSFYMSKKYLPIFDPEEVSLSKLQELAKGNNP